MRYKLILFDLDGTLLDTLEDLSQAVNHAMRLRDLPLHTRDEYQLMVGDGVRNLVKRALPASLQGDEAVIDAALADFKTYYTAHIDVYTRPYPGVSELLHQLHVHGVQLAVASNKFQEGTEHLIRKFFPDIPFIAVLGQRPDFPLKPDPEIVGEVLRRAHVEPAEALMVGDSPTDMKTAANGGIDGMAVSWGYRPMTAAQGLRVADTTEDILNSVGITADVRTNPFFGPYNTPHDTAPFDRIRLEDYEEAFMEGIRRDNEQIDKTINNPEKPTFDNTIINKDEDTEGYYDLLDRVSTVFFNLLSAETNDEMDALAQKMQPILTQHANDVRLNERLFERVKYVHRHHRKLTPEEKMLLDNCYDGFVHSGALLDKAGKDRLRQLTEEASMLSLQFSQNLLKENKAYTLHITDEKQLDGLPQSAIDAAAEEARQRGLDGWLFTLDSPSYSPFMTYSTQRELRRQMYMARNTVCIHDNDCNNLDICKRLINLRREIAQLLGFKTYADYVLKNRMAGKVKNVYKLLYDLIDAYKPTAKKERDELRNSQLSTLNSQLEPWDVPFYTHKLQIKKYNIDAEMLRPYFQLDKVIEGVFGLANRLYGITFKENKDIPVYHPDVKAYEVFDRDGSYLAVFYADFHPRKGKQGGAWMTQYQGQYIDRKGENVRPHVSVVMNLTKPTPEKPALLTLGEVETFLHEFGHSLHGMFANTRFESLSGTNVWWDFVELPSQFMENYAVEKEFLRTFAFHYQTGEPLPDELIRRIVKSRNFMAATACLRQVSFGLLDMAYYTQKDEFTDDIIAFEKKAWKKAILGKQLPDTCMTVQFSHIMAGGYAAGYYSYKWAEVLDADAFSVFKKHGIFDQKTAQSFRDNILSKGGTENPMVLYKRFRGGEPTIDALLNRNGIKRKDK